jgi:hypothetical protein
MARERARQLMLAARKQRGQDAQVRIREQPAFRLASGGSGSTHEGAQMLAASHGTQVLGADPREAGDLIFGENFLIGFDRDHFSATLLPISIGVLRRHQEDDLSL